MNVVTQSASVKDRLLDSFPATSYCIPSLLSIAQIEETTRVPTACVECCARPRLRINPDFVRDHASTPEKLLMLVLHELHHIVLGHTRLYPRITKLDNLVFDAIINSVLCHMQPERAYTSMFTDLYSDERLPECFLRPPKGWIRDKISPLPPALAASPDSKLAQLYRRLYSRAGVTYQELRDALRFEEPPQSLQDRLLGNHQSGEADSSFAEDYTRNDSELIEEIERIVEDWRTASRHLGVDSLQELLQSIKVQPDPVTDATRLSKLMNRIGDAGRRVGGSNRTPNRNSIEMPIPRFDRRSAIMKALGSCPMMYRYEITWRPTLRSVDKVHVYLDVSASVAEYRGALFASILACRELVHPVIHQFSTQVHDVSMRELSDGLCKTTGGTSIGCVADHMMSRGIRRAVFVTDGFVGRLSGAQLKYLKGCKIGVAFPAGRANYSDLQSVVSSWTRLEGV